MSSVSPRHRSAILDITHRTHARSVRSSAAVFNARMHYFHSNQSVNTGRIHILALRQMQKSVCCLRLMGNIKNGATLCYTMALVISLHFTVSSDRVLSFLESRASTQLLKTEAKNRCEAQRYQPRKTNRFMIYFRFIRECHNRKWSLWHIEKTTKNIYQGGPNQPPVHQEMSQWQIYSTKIKCITIAMYITMLNSQRVVMIELTVNCWQVPLIVHTIANSRNATRDKRLMLRSRQVLSP